MRAWLAVALAACGGSSATPDASTPDGVESIGSVTVVVSLRGKPVTGVPVVFQSADGATTFTAVTSRDGASGYDLSDGFVTVLLPKAITGVDHLWTYAGVRPDDVLRLELEPQGPKRIELAVTANADVVNAPLLIYSTCGSEGPIGVAPNVVSTLAFECAGSLIDLLAVRTDPDTNEPISSQFLGGIPVTEVAATFTGTYAPVPAIPIAYTNPNAFPYLYTMQALVTANGSLFETTAGGDPAEPGTIARPLVPGAQLLVAAGGYPQTETDRDQQTLLAISPDTSPLAIDMTPQLPKYADDGAFTGSKLVWSQTGGNVTPTFARAHLRFSGSTTWEWQIVAPRGAASEIVFPALPDGRFDPSATMQIIELMNVHLGKRTYDSVRGSGFAKERSFAPTTVGDITVVQHRFKPEPI